MGGWVEWVDRRGGGWVHGWIDGVVVDGLACLQTMLCCMHHDASLSLLASGVHSSGISLRNLTTSS